VSDSRLRLLIHAVVVATLLAACTAGPGSAPSAASSPSSGSVPPTDASSSPSKLDAAPLTVYGAASLKSALDLLKTAWEPAHPGSTLTISTDSSAALETQIEQGAPADVFLSADTANPKKLTDKALADGAAVDFAGNILTVVVPAANPAGITSPADLAKSGVKVIAAGDDVPITKYAKQVVANLARVAGYPSGFEAAYAANIASKEDNVKAVIAKIELGEGDAGIVYVTDAQASAKVMTVAIPAEANVPATYAGVVVKASAHATTAHAFLDWVAGAEGQQILAGFGFLPPSTAG
jgi:molybdate transport system substrate-binding protein